MVSTIPAHALYFSGYEFAKSTLRPSKSQEDKGPLVHFTAGVFADVCGSMIWVPMVHILLYYIILCYIMLCFVMLCYIWFLWYVLYYVTL
jgi:hypothetical protein